MASTAANAAAAVRIERRYGAAPEKIWRAWTDPEALKRWWCPDKWVCTAAEIDLRAGGEYRIGMRQQETGQVLTIAGQYLEVLPPEKLVYTWTWTGGPFDGAGPTRVTVVLRESGGGTDLILTHDQFVSVEMSNEHNKGWNAVLNRLEAYL